MKKLKHVDFNMEEELVRFVNGQEIKQKDIQQITNSPMRSHLYYWGDVIQKQGEVKK